MEAVSCPHSTPKLEKQEPGGGKWKETVQIVEAKRGLSQRRGFNESWEVNSVKLYLSKKTVQESVCQVKKSVTLIPWGYDGQLEKYVGGKQNYWLLKGFFYCWSVFCNQGPQKNLPENIHKAWVSRDSGSAQASIFLGKIFC